MAQIQLPTIPAFRPTGDPTSISQRFQKWVKSFQYFLGASGITDDARKKATLLHLIGLESQEIFDTLNPADDTYQSALQAFIDHFSVQKNIPFERSKFHSCKQKQGESIEQFVTNLRKLASTCDYGTETDNQIRDQVIAACFSTKFRKRLLAEPDLTLQKVVSIGQSLESAHYQSKEIESSAASSVESVNFTRRPQSRPRNADKSNKNTSSSKSCGRCGAKGHISSECRRTKNHTCSKCGKVGHFQSMCRSKPKSAPSQGNACALTTDSSSADGVSVQLARTIIQSDSDDDIYAFSIRNDSSHRDTFPVTVDGTQVSVFIDSGTTVNIIDEHGFRLIESRPTLLPSSIKIYPYQSNVPLRILGSFDCKIEANEHSVFDRLYVAEGKHGSLLSRATAESLDLLRIGPSVNTLDATSVPSTSAPLPNDKLNEILSKHDAVFKGLGKLENFEVKLHVNPEVTPVQQPIRRIPYHTRKKVSAETQRLLDLDVIERVSGPTSWINPIVAVPKGDKIRLCLDMRRANEAIIRERHVIPTMMDILPDLHGAKYFCKIDLREGYHQLCLAKESRPLTCFATHEGLFQYKRLIYGVNTAFEVFQKQIELVISGIPGAKNISDDVLIWGKDVDETLSRLNQVLQRFSENNLKINLDKCTLLASELIYSGVNLSSEGVSPDKERVRAIVECKAPTNASEVRSFLGVVNFCKQFLPDFSTVTAPLRLLTKKNKKFVWGTAQQTAFETLKTQLTSSTVMSYYNPDAVTKLTVDASPFGLGGILSQEQPDGSFRPVAYGSRALNNVESRYSQIEREALAVLWGCEHFHYYVYDRHILIETDHKPLISAMGRKSSPTPRIQRWLLRLQAYDYDLMHISGATNGADFFSRSPLPAQSSHSDIATEYVNMILTDAVPKALGLQDISQATANDPTLQKVIQCLSSNWVKTPDIQPYFPIRHDLTVQDGILLFNNRIVIPQSLREDVLALAHCGHQGISKTKALLREKVWWPSMNSQVESAIQNCHPCQLTTASKSSAQPLQPTKMPDDSWDTLAIDLQGPYPTGDNLFVMIDYRSRYPIVYFVRKTTSSKLIKCMNKTFSVFGYPRVLVSDNGSQFVSDEFKKYCRSHNITHHPVSPYFPSANGEVENMNRTLKKVVQRAFIEGKDVRQAVQDFLLVYRSTPHSVTQVSPADLLFKHKIKTDIPSMPQNRRKDAEDKKAESADAHHKTKAKEYVDARRRAREIELSAGDSVITRSQIKRNKLTPLYEDNVYTVVKCYPRSVLIEDSKGRQLIRNKSHVKRYFSQDLISSALPVPDPDNSDDFHVPFCYILPDVPRPEDDDDPLSGSETESDWVTDSDFSPNSNLSDSDDAVPPPASLVADQPLRRSTRLQIAASRQ